MVFVYGMVFMYVRLVGTVFQWFVMVGVYQGGINGGHVWYGTCI